VLGKLFAGGGKGRGKYRVRLIALATLLAVSLLLAASLISCGQAVGDGPNAFPDSVLPETGNGLVLEGEGPIPGRLIARSTNPLSNEEDQLVLREISQELDRLVDLAGQIDAAVAGESTATEDLGSRE
jgi:hypothetical protein